MNILHCIQTGKKHWRTHLILFMENIFCKICLWDFAHFSLGHVYNYSNLLFISHLMSKNGHVASNETIHLRSRVFYDSTRNRLFLDAILKLVLCCLWL